MLSLTWSGLRADWLLCSACIASIIRIQYIARTSEGKDITCEFYLQNSKAQSVLRCRPDIEVESVVWSVIEPCVGIVCGCLSTLRPLFRTIFGGGWLSERSGTSWKQLLWTRVRSSNQKIGSIGRARSGAKWPYHKQRVPTRGNDSTAVFNEQSTLEMAPIGRIKVV